MGRIKISSIKWTLVLVLVLMCQLSYSRPQEPTNVVTTPSELVIEKSTENLLRSSSENAPTETTTNPLVDNNSSSRYVKSKPQVIGDSIKMVANQLLETNSTTTTAAVIDTRIPPKLKNQLANKQKIKTRLDDSKIENSHAGIAVPVTMEDLEKEKFPENHESTTTNDGISTWILLSNPTPKENESVSTEPTKPEEKEKKKVSSTKNKTKRPQQTGTKSKRPIIGSVNKSDLIASGSAINDNVLNKIKDTVLSNVQKNKENKSPSQKVPPTTSTTAIPMKEIATTKKEEVTKLSAPIVPIIKVTAKPTKKKNKIKQKITTTTTEEPVMSDSALLPAEPKEQEIELEISTPATTTKKPKRKSSTKRKKTKTKKHKTSVSTKSPVTAVAEVKKSNKTKSVKPATKKPDSPITTQIYNYLSREVMPSVGVGVIGLAGLVGIASYFLYPFATPVRRTFEVDKKDDIYRHNAEEYANEGNGQPEEEMLGTVLAGMPAHSKHKLNPYMNQMAHRYPAKKEQELKYRHVATNNYETPNYNMHYPQQKTGLAHGVVYADTSNYKHQPHDSRNVYTTENKYTYEQAYTAFPAVEPIYAAPQTGPSSLSDYGNDAGGSVVYGVKPSSETDFKPVYPFEGQIYSETTNSPVTHPSTSMYLGSNNEAEPVEEPEIEDPNMEDENKFVVGNVPKEITESATAAVVPEHGPRKLIRKRRSLRRVRSVAQSIEDILKAAKSENKDIFLSNEIDEALGNPLSIQMSGPTQQNNFADIHFDENSNAKKMDKLSEKVTTDDSISMTDHKIVESVSTIPFENIKPEKTTTESELSNEIETTTKQFKVYEVFATKESSPLIKEASTIENKNTETTTEINKSETTSTMPTVPLETKIPESSSVTPDPTNNPNNITYPPINGGGGFFTFLKRLIEFKYRLGMSILQTTSDSLNRYLRGMENTARKVVRGSKV